MILRAGVAAVIALVSILTGSGQAAVARVLLIGNSLTYANDLPRMIEEVAPVACEAVAYPNYGLDDHWRDGRALEAIRRGGWTHVVLQQGPSSLRESRELLVRYARLFAREIGREQAQVVLYGVWPSADRRAYFGAVSASYGAAARAAGGALVPAGDGWQAAWKRDRSLPLYGPDGFHPSPMGSYIAALMIAAQVAGVEPSPTLPRAVVARPEQGLMLRDAARDALSAARAGSR